MTVKPKGGAQAPLLERMVTQPAELAACLDHLRRCPQIGLDTEFVGEQSYHPQLCLIQVAALDCLYLIDPLTCGPLDAFWEVVVSADKEVVFHAGREDIRICLQACGRPPANIIDLQIAAGLVGLHYPLGHGALVKETLGISLSKGETLTEWGNRPLTRSQISYAFDDVRHLLPVWQRLSARIDQAGRRDWVKEECRRLAISAATNTPADALASEKWRKLRGAGSLDRRRLAIVRELFAWREAAAAKADRPPRTVVRDDLLVEIARRQPTSDRDLQVIRGLPKRDFPAILQVVARCRELPLDDCPPLPERDQDPPRVTIVTGIMMAVLSDLCIRRKLAPNLTASTTEVRYLVRAAAQGLPVPEDSQLASGWRQQHILPELMAVLEGRRSVRVANVKADAPLE
jgi:ribonuclease D